MGYLHYFKTQSQFNAAYNGTGYTEPWVSCVYEQKKSDYNKSKLWDGVSSVLDLRGVDNNPNLEFKGENDNIPSWTTYEEANVVHKYYFKKLKSFVLPGLTGDTPIIQTVLTDWAQQFSQTGDTGTARFVGHGYDWGASSYDYGELFLSFGEDGGIWATVYD